MELVWAQTRPEVPAVEAAIETVDEDTPTLSVTRIVVFVIVELEVKVGAVMAITGATVSMT